MGLLDRFRNMDDVRGVRLTVDAPPEFRWSDGSLPITLTFEGRGDDDQVAVQVELRLEQDHDGEREQNFRYTVPVRELLPAGQTVVRSYAVPLQLDDRPIHSDHLEQAPSWMSGLVIRVGMGSVGFTGPCKLEVLVVYESSRRPGTAKRRITARPD